MWQPDQVRPMDDFGTVVTLWITWTSIWIKSGVKEKGTKVLQRSVFFLLFWRFLPRSGTCGSSGEWQPDQARPMDEFGTVVTLWDHLASIGIRVWSERKRDQSDEKKCFFLTF